MVPTLSTLASGMDRTDSLWYHLPLAARFVQTGDLGQHLLLRPDLPRVVLSRRTPRWPTRSGCCSSTATSLSPLINLGWLAVALLAAWCIGRPYGLGPQALIGASIALGSQSLVEFQAGEA